MEEPIVTVIAQLVHINSMLNWIFWAIVFNIVFK